MSFSFVGQVPSSKSLYNRALVIQSYSPFVSIEGIMDCEDVELMKKGMKSLSSGEPIYCGWAGTVFRFMALRASRIPGTHRIIGEPELINRPQQELSKILLQLGVEISLDSEGITIVSNGWKPTTDSLEINCQKSSQFASAVLLNCWQLDRPIAISLIGPIVSKSYLDMTVQCLKYFGFEVGIDGREYYVAANQNPQSNILQIEPDMSSAFSIAALAGLSGDARISGFLPHSWQPDYKFVRLLQNMGVKISFEKEQLKVTQASDWKPLSYNMIGTPDLFPVLAVLCAFADGSSKLFGAPHLKYKESNRVEKICELLEKIKVEFDVLEDGLIIHGQKSLDVSSLSFEYDPENDHRLVMAASLLLSRGAKVVLKNPDCVRKSYPGFLEIIGYG